MKRIDRYIASQVTQPMIIAFVAIAILMISGMLQQQVKELLEEIPFAPLRVDDFVWMALYALPMMVGMIIPITYLFGLMLTYERMSRYREIVAMVAGGIPMSRIAMPTIALSALLSVVCFIVQDYFQPWAFQRLMKLARHDLPLRLTLDLLPTGKMSDYGDLKIYIQKRNEKKELLNIVVLQPGREGKVIAFYAEKARWKKEGDKSILEMTNGFWIESQEDSREILRGSFQRLEKEIPPLKPLDTIKLRTGMSLRELLREHKKLSERYEETKGLPLLSDLKKYRSEIAERLSFPIMCLAIGLIASPIGVRMRGAGPSYAFSAGFLIAFLYFILHKAVGGGGLMSLPIRCLVQQIPNLLFAMIGLVLLAKVDRV
ncbi:MAG: LptF/LptG family permease [Candidatus Hydrogenedentes bacterium]|nr:LptF/LptG family permease [Candidatus Hydrogenedentota bacterium]